MFRPMAFLVAGLALTLAAGSSATAQLVEEQLLGVDQMVEPAVPESSEPGFIDDQSYLAGIVDELMSSEAAFWNMTTLSDPSDTEPSALPREAFDLEQLEFEPLADSPNSPLLIIAQAP